eukprot:jgi/Chlat1/4857/Chrsp31S04890
MAQHAEASDVVDFSMKRSVGGWLQAAQFSHKAQILHHLPKGLPYIETVLEKGTARDTSTAMHADEVLNHAKATEDHELQANATEALVVLDTLRLALRAKQNSMTRDSASWSRIGQSADVGDERTRWLWRVSLNMPYISHHAAGSNLLATFTPYPATSAPLNVRASTSDFIWPASVFDPKLELAECKLPRCASQVHSGHFIDANLGLGWIVRAQYWSPLQGFASRVPGEEHPARDSTSNAGWDSIRAAGLVDCGRVPNQCRG